MAPKNKLEQENSKFRILFEKLKQSEQCYNFCILLGFVIGFVLLIAFFELLGYLYNHNVGHRTTFWVNFGEGIMLFSLLLFYLVAEYGMYQNLFVIWDDLDVKFLKVPSELSKQDRGNNAEVPMSIGWTCVIILYAFSWFPLYGIWHNPSTESLNFLAGIGVFLASRLILLVCTPPLMTLIYHINSTFFLTSVRLDN